MPGNLFDSNEIGKLEYYVYVYLDPRDDQPFYVGKGLGNRVFSHLNDASETAKVSRIAAIRAEGVEPKIDILAFGLDEKTAFKVEAAVIDLIGIDNLTNKAKGRGASEFGRMSVEAVHAKFSSEIVDNFNHNCVLIKIQQSFASATKQAAIELYDATRGSWVVGTNRASTEYAVAVFDGTVREVYRIAAWLPAGSTMYATRDIGPANRWEFVGNIAEESVRSAYRLKRVDSFFPFGAQNPIRYVGPAFG